MFLLTAGALEVVATTLFRFTEGFTRLWPSVGFFATGFASMLLLQRSLTEIPLGTAYAIWTGIGAAGTAILGIWLFAEPANAVRAFLLTTIIASVIGLKIAST
jgi:quaternary ammonium compound-resistance protein SugE